MSEREPVSQALLARHLGIAKLTLSEALKWLERQGCIRREPDTADPRGMLVYRTPPGTAAMSRGSVLETPRLRPVLAKLNSDEPRRAVEGLELLARAAVSVPKRRSL